METRAVKIQKKKRKREKKSKQKIKQKFYSIYIKYNILKILKLDPKFLLVFKLFLDNLFYKKKKFKYKKNIKKHHISLFTICTIFTLTMITRHTHVILLIHSQLFLLTGHFVLTAFLSVLSFALV